MTGETNLVGEKKQCLTNTPLLSEGKVKFLQIKQDTIRQKHEKK